MIVGRPDTLSCVVAAARRRARHHPRVSAIGRPADLALRVERGRAGSAATTAPTGGPSAGVRERAADIARRAGIRFDLDAVDPDDAGAALLVGFPDRLAGAAAAGPVPAAQRHRARGSPTTTRWRRRRSSSPPTSTASARAPASASARPSTRRPSPRCSTASSRTAGWSGTPTPTTSSSASSAGSTPCASATERRRPAPGEDTTAGPRRPGPGDEARRPAVDGRRPSSCGRGWRSCAADARRRRGRTSPTGRCWPTLDEWLAPYLAGATGRADLDRLDLAVLLRAQLPWPLGAELDELAPRDVARCRPAGRRRSTTPPSARRCRCACRTCSA